MSVTARRYTDKEKEVIRKISVVADAETNRAITRISFPREDDWKEAWNREYHRRLREQLVEIGLNYPREFFTEAGR